MANGSNNKVNNKKQQTTMYYQATVKVKVETDSGSIKNRTYKHLVQDVAISGVEEQITREYTGSVNDWELVSVAETKIVSVLGEIKA